MQSCRLFGEKTSARLNRLRLNIRAIVQELKSELLNINVAYETLSDLTKLFKTPYFQGLSEAQQNYFYQIYQDLDRYQHRYGR